MKTPTGFTYYPEHPFYCNAVTKLVNIGGVTMTLKQKLTFVSVSEPNPQHENELKCDFKVKDEFGEIHDISEDHIWQY